jgi:hypothetical protein
LAHVTLDGDQARAMRMGQRITLDQTFDDEEVAAVDANGDLVGVLVAPQRFMEATAGTRVLVMNRRADSLLT